MRALANFIFWASAFAVQASSQLTIPSLSTPQGDAALALNPVIRAADSDVAVTAAASQTKITIPHPITLTYGNQEYIFPSATTIVIPCGASGNPKLKPRNTITITSIATITAKICTTSSPSAPPYNNNNNNNNNQVGPTAASAGGGGGFQTKTIPGISGGSGVPDFAMTNSAAGLSMKKGLLAGGLSLVCFILEV